MMHKLYDLTLDALFRDFIHSLSTLILKIFPFAESKKRAEECGDLRIIWLSLSDNLFSGTFLLGVLGKAA